MIELNKIYCENNLETMAKMPDDFIDLVVTSPPYDNLRDYNGFSFEFEKVAMELFRVIKTGGVLVWIVSDSTVNGSETVTSAEQKLYFKSIGFNIHDTMIYEKNGASLPDATRYLQCFEYMFIFSKGKPKTINKIKDRKNRFIERWGKGRVVREKDGSLSPRGNYRADEYGFRFNIWRFNTGAGYSTKDELAFKHPAIFPEKLAADHIYSWSNKGDLVYDPFMGSGTVAKMAHIQERNWIGSEISQEYVDIANKRIEPYLKQTRMAI